MEGRADLQACLGALVDRVRGTADELSQAAANGVPGEYLLADELDRRLPHRPTQPAPRLSECEEIEEIAARFELTPLEADLLLIAASPDLDERAALLYAYAQDDLTKRRPTAGFALRLCGIPLDSAEGHMALGPDGELALGGLVALDDPGAPFPARPLRCDDRVVRWLLGIDWAGEPLDRLLVEAPAFDCEEAVRVAAGIRAGVGAHILRSPPGSDPRGVAAAAVAELDVAALFVDLDRLSKDDDIEAIALAARREARLRGRVLVAGPFDRLVEAGADLDSWISARWPTILHGIRNWDPSWSKRPPRIITAPPVQASNQIALWQEILGDHAPSAAELAEAASAFRLTGEQIMTAALAAVGEADADSRPLTAEDLRRSARARNASSLDRLARRIEPTATWEDIVLPDDTIAKLRELVVRTRHRDLIFQEWGLASTGNRGDGLAALFAGSSGTGKTLAAEVIAHALGLDLYIVDLSSIVDKFIGETEKNLDRIFDEAERVNGVLVFDEADALFGKRSEVKDSHDRYANLETAYLLQRMEAFSGTAILTTNLRSNLDDAFARRLGSIINFPMPDAQARFELWRRFFGAKVPCEDIDYEFCAQNFELSGANIRNIALAAAFRAAEEGPPIVMHDVILAIESEYEKLGRLRSKAEFGKYASLLSGTER